MLIGAHAYTGYPHLNGEIDDIYIYDRALSAAEIDSLYHEGDWDTQETGTVTDFDGNVYQTIVIGDQEWMAENLKVTHYRDGTVITPVTDNAVWIELTTEAYCIYNNNAGDEVDTYGALYNWYAVDDSRNIAPEGWHVPTDNEWKELEMALGMSQSEADGTSWRGTNEGSKLAGNADLWDNGALENDFEFGSSGFTALPGGYRYYIDGDLGIGWQGDFWSATESDNNNAWFRVLYNYHTDISRINNYKQHGFSVRCVRDREQIAIEISDVSAFTSSSVFVPVLVSLDPDSLYRAAELDFSGYADGLEFIGIDTVGTMIGGLDWTWAENEVDSLLHTAFAGSDEISGEGVFCYLEFLVTGEICTSVPVNCYYALINDVEATDITNGFVHIDPTPVVGDVDENNSIQALDASDILIHLLDDTYLGCQGLANADTYLDGAIDAMDATMILRYIVELEESLPVTPGEAFLAGGNMNTEDQEAVPNSTISIPFNISDGQNIYAFEGSIVYDTSVITPAEDPIIWSELLAGFLISLEVEDGLIRFVGAGANPDGEEGIFLSANFILNDGFDIGDQTTVTLNEIKLNSNLVIEDVSATILGVVGIDDAVLPQDYVLDQNYPNPFNPSTTIRYGIPEESNVSLMIYDVRGNVVQTLESNRRIAGWYNVEWNGEATNGKSISTGIYFARLIAGDYTQVIKLVYLK